MRYSRLNLIFDFLLPRFCSSCNKKLTVDDKIICDSCFSEFENVEEELLKSEYNRKFRNDGLISDFYSAYIFRDKSPLEKLIHKLKYEQNYQIGRFLGEKIGHQIRLSFESWSADLIIPIPLHALKKAERGFNQSDEIAKGLSKTLKLAYSSRVVKRIRFTKTQTQFSLSERKENISNAFKVMRKKSINGKNIILVDDVITTGATTSECAKVLLNAGANKIYVVSVALAD